MFFAPVELTTAVCTLRAARRLCLAGLICPRRRLGGPGKLLHLRALARRMGARLQLLTIVQHIVIPCKNYPYEIDRTVRSQT